MLIWFVDIELIAKNYIHIVYTDIVRIALVSLYPLVRMHKMKGICFWNTSFRLHSIIQGSMSGFIGVGGKKAQHVGIH